MGRIFAGILLAIVLVYGITRGIPLLRGPYIEISELRTNDEGLTIFSGTAIHTETLVMNGGTLLIDGNGNFSTRLNLPRGGSILTLTATDRFGRSRTLQQSVITP